jgi:autotransporter-associated beta strand protein
MKRSRFILAASAVCIVGLAYADTLVAPVAATAQSNYGSRTPQHAIDGSGMTPSSPVTALSAAGVAADTGMWLSSGTKQTWITFDFGSVQTVTGFRLWNYNEVSIANVSYAGRGIKTAGVYAGDSMLQAGMPYTYAGETWGRLVETVTFAQAPGTAGYTGEDYLFPAPVTTRYLQLYVVDNYGFDNYTGISEIRFYTTSVSESESIGESGTAAYFVATNDLLQTAVTSVETNLIIDALDNNLFSFGTLASLTDGTFGTASATGGLCIASGTMTYYLDTTARPAGYSIAAVDTYSGWANNGRVNQNYTLSFRKVGSATFGDSLVVSYAFSGANTSKPALARVHNANLGLTGVDAVRLDFSYPVQQNGGVGYKEIDVFEDLGVAVSPVAATAQSYYADDDRAPIHAVDGSGMFTGGRVSNQAIANVSTRSTVWLSNGTKATWIAFDLGAVRTVTGLHLWNYNENPYRSFAGRGIKTAGLYVGDSLPTNGTEYASAGAAWGTFAENLAFRQAPATTNYRGEDYALSAPVTGRYFQLYVTDNYGLDDYTGISEILFYCAQNNTEVTRLSSGSKVIADGATNIVRVVDGTGTAAPLTLENAVTTVDSLVLRATGGDTAIDLAGQTLALDTLTLLDGTGGLSLAGPGTLTFAGNLRGGMLLLDNRGTNALTVQAGIADGASALSLVKKGAGPLVLSGANTYTGGTQLKGGTVRQTAGTLSSMLSIDNTMVKLTGGTLDCPMIVTVNGNGGNSASIAISGTHVSNLQSVNLVSGTAPITVTDGGTLLFGNLTSSIGFSLGSLLVDGGTLGVSAKGISLAAEGWIEVPVTVGAGGAIIDTSNGNAILNSPVVGKAGVGTAGFTKMGDRALTLFDYATGIGTVEVAAGTLELALSDAIIHYDFDTASVNGTTLRNLGTGGSAYDGVIAGSPVTGTAGKTGEAFVFSAGNQGITTAGDVPLRNRFTFAAWIKSSGSTNLSQRIITVKDCSDGYLGTGPSNTFWMIVTMLPGENYGTRNPISTQRSDDTENWHHVAMTWDGQQSILYYDGVPVQTNPVAGRNNKTFGKIGFGNNAVPNGEFWNGAMDEAYVFDRALSAREIAGLAALSWNAVDQLPVETELRVDEGANVALNIATQTVARLALDGRLKKFGDTTWGAPASGAEHEDTHFSGAGILHVLGPENPGTKVWLQ